jgi:serine/threonine-protein phosphatase 2A regulatory subunit B'
MADCLSLQIHEVKKFNGISEILDIYACIISGFSVPYRQEHIVFFKTIMIPLHKAFCATLFFDSLLRDCMLFITKDNSLAIPLIEGLLKFWPVANSNKEGQFLSELHEVLELCDKEKIKPIVGKLFKRIAKCITGSQIHNSDRAISFFEDGNFIYIIKQHKELAFDVFIPILHKLSENHWHRQLKSSLSEVNDVLRKIDHVLYDTVLENSETLKYDK